MASHMPTETELKDPRKADIKMAAIAIRHRARTPKVKTGCITCKIRHIKCDETKPSCQKCTTTGRKCDGYQEPKKKKKPEYEVVVRNGFNSPLFQRQFLSSSMSGTEQERRCFYYFCAETASSMSGFFDSEFWGSRILQASHFSPVIMHAVIALGALHEAYLHDDGGSDFDPSKELTSRQQFAQDQSNQALQYLIKHLSARTEESYELVLVACILFVCYETLKGNRNAAIMHLDSGLKILGNWTSQDKEDKPCVIMSSRDSFIQQVMVPLFAHLDIQASTKASSRHVKYQLLFKDEESSMSPEIPSSFSSLAEAKTSLVTQLYWMLNYHQRASDLWRALTNNPYFPPESRNGVIFTGFLAVKEAHRLRLGTWLDNMNKFLKTCDDMSSRDLQAALLLKLHHLTSTVMLAATTFDGHVDFDKHIDTFNRIVNIAESLCTPLHAEHNTLSQSSQGQEQQQRRPSFLFDLGIVDPLSYVAYNCREPVLRRRAIALLASAPRREGVWDSLIAASIARRIMDLEEQGMNLGPVYDPSCITVNDRIRVRGIDYFPGERRCLVHYLRGRRLSLRLSVMDEEWITW